MHVSTNNVCALYLSADCSTTQAPSSPLHFLVLTPEDTKNTRLVRPVSTPEESPSSLPPLDSPTAAIKADSPVTVLSNGVVDSPVKVSGDPRKTHMLPRTVPLPLTSPAEKTVPSWCSQAACTDRSPHSLLENTPKQKGSQETLSDKNKTGESMSEHRADPPAGTPAFPAAQRASARRALFGNLAPPPPVRRAKSEGHVGVGVATDRQAQSAVPEVCTDATVNDRLWSELEPGSHRDSMSSSSSISSNDTVIDLSLPNLARKSFSSPPTSSSSCDPHWANCRRSALLSYNVGQVSKSKSNPNLQQSECFVDEIKPHPLQPPQEAPVDSPNRLTQRRHTWNRLYMEGLKQSSAKRPGSAAAAAAVAASATAAVTSSMSKSLGDLTSDDISCNFDSKYRSISRSFIIRPSRDQGRRGSPQKSQPLSNLTEQLRKLTDVEPLTASDFAAENRPEQSQEEPVDETLVRRTSSRSQSRVRYIANRAKKAQERQRLQGLIQGRSANFSLTGSVGSGSVASPIEERGNPEGACCVARSPCSSLDLLSQLTPLGSPSPRLSQTFLDPESSEVLFRLKL